MLSFRTRFSRHVSVRLRKERIIWLTTVDSTGDDAPWPRPVWFHWDGRTVLIFSQKSKAKLRHISHNPRVALNFNTDREGGDVAVIVGDAHILEREPSRKLIRRADSDHTAKPAGLRRVAATSRPPTW